MAGTHTGGLKTAQTNKVKYGEDYYQRIGAIGGTKSRTGGFAFSRELAIRAGRLGGSARKGKKYPRSK